MLLKQLIKNKKTTEIADTSKTTKPKQEQTEPLKLSIQTNKPILTITERKIETFEKNTEEKENSATFDDETADETNSEIDYIEFVE